MPIGATIGAGALGAGGSIVSGILGSNAAKSAANTQAASYASALQLAKGEIQPYVDTGNAAGTSLAALYGLGPQGSAGTQSQFNAFTNLPSYQFPFQQGVRATNFGLGAGGLLQSGAQSKAQQQFGQGLASTYLQSNYVSPLMQLYQTGAGAASSLGGLGAGLLTGQGAAQAGGIVGSTNALTSGIAGASNSASSTAGNLALYSLLAKNPQFGGSQSTSSYQTSGPTGGFAPAYTGFNQGSPVY